MSSPQRPIHSGYGAATTAREVVAGRDLGGRVAVVTGGHAGLGLETTQALAEAGATVIVGARSLDRARVALAGIKGVEVAALDLFDAPSIDTFAARFQASGRPLHILVNNAGVMAAPILRDARGFESQLAVNHIGHFQLTARLWPALLRARGARVVALSSRGHARAALDFDDPHFERRPYDKWIAYGQSKTANVLFAVGLDRRLGPRGVHALALHPGAIMTDLARHLESEDFQFLQSRNRGMQFKSVEAGAATSVFAATAPELEGRGGLYLEDCHVAQVNDAPDALDGVKSYAIDPALAERLWSLSEAAVDQRVAVE